MPVSTKNYRRRVAIGLALSLATATGVVGVISTPAFAIPSKPVTDNSFYIENNNMQEAYNLGCSEGSRDLSIGKDATNVVLAFGTQKSDLTGNYMPATSNFISKADVENVTINYAAGYWACSGTTTLYLDMSTNNSGPTPTNARGRDWGSVVQYVHDYVMGTFNGQIIVQGANDIEPSWSTFSSAQAWVQGFHATFNGLYLDTASSDNCPQTTHTNGTCNNGWTQDNEWWINWGFAPAIVSPQIYYIQQASQWYQISLWAVAAHGSPIGFTGVLDQWPDDHNTYTADSAWSVFLGKLWSTSSTAVTPQASMEITYES
jgi:hypothetical protein